MSAAARCQQRSFHLDAPRARVLPLFTARGEREWVPGWDPKLLSGAEERGSVFQTQHGGAPETTWIVIDYRPAEGRASYARVARDSNIGLVDIVCSDATEGGTDVSVAYTLTALGTDAQAWVEAFLEPQQFAGMIDEWRAATSAALARGAV